MPIAERQRVYRALFITDIDLIDLNEIRSSTQRGWPIGSERFKTGLSMRLIARRGPHNAGGQGEKRTHARKRGGKSYSDPVIPCVAPP